MRKTVQCVVAYPATLPWGASTKFDLEYYLKTHMALIDKYWGPYGLKSWEVNEGLEGDGIRPRYIIQATLQFESMEGLLAALAAPETNKTRADIFNYTNVEPEIWVLKEVGRSMI